MNPKPEALSKPQNKDPNYDRTAIEAEPDSDMEEKGENVLIRDDCHAFDLGVNSVGLRSINPIPAVSRIGITLQIR